MIINQGRVYSSSKWEKKSSTDVWAPLLLVRMRQWHFHYLPHDPVFHKGRAGVVIHLRELQLREGCRASREKEYGAVSFFHPPLLKAYHLWMPLLRTEHLRTDKDTQFFRLGKQRWDDFLKFYVSIETFSSSGCALLVDVGVCCLPSRSQSKLTLLFFGFFQSLCQHV